MDFRVIGLDRVRDLLEDRCLTRFGRRDDHASLALPDRRHQVDDARRHIGGVAGDLEAQLLVREKRRQVLELRPVAGLVGDRPGHGVHSDEGGVLLVVGGRPEDTVDHVTLAQPVTAHLGYRNVHIRGTGQVAVGPEETVAFLAQVQKARNKQRARPYTALPVMRGELALALGATRRLLTVTPPASPAIAEARVGIMALATGVPPLEGRRTVCAGPFAWSRGTLCPTAMPARPLLRQALRARRRPWWRLRCLLAPSLPPSRQA